MAERTGLTRIPVLRRWNLTPREAPILAAIVLVTIAIYLPSLRYGWVSDDWGEFVHNKLIHSWSFVGNSFIHDSWWFYYPNPNGLPKSAYYRPLENTWFAANALLFGMHPAAWHLAKIVLYVVTVALCFRVAQLLTGDVAVGLLTAAIFAVMPAHVDAVVWASAIPEPLSTVFELGALLFLIGRKPGWSRGLLISAALYGLAILTHESAILFPLIVAAYVFLFEGGDERTASAAQTDATRLRIVSALRACAPFAVVAIAYMCARANALGLESIFGLHRVPGAALWQGFVPPTTNHGPVEFLMTLPVVLCAYLAVLVLPAMTGPAHDVQWITHPQPLVFISAATLMIVGAPALILAWRSSNRRIYLFCAAWSLVTIAPTLNLNGLLPWTLVEDRYLYAPSIGWSLALAVAALQVAASGTRARNAVAAAIAVLMTVYAASTMQTEHYWHDDVTYWRRCVEIQPFVPGDHILLAAALNKAGDPEGAARVLERGVTIHPGNPRLRLKLAAQYQMMGRDRDFEREYGKFKELSAALIQQHRSEESPGTFQPAPAHAPH